MLQLLIIYYENTRIFLTINNFNFKLKFNINYLIFN